MPVEARLVAPIVSVARPEPGKDAGLNEALVRSGKPLRLRFTVDVKPFADTTVTVYDVCEPRRTV